MNHQIAQTTGIYNPEKKGLEQSKHQWDQINLINLKIKATTARNDEDWGYQTRGDSKIQVHIRRNQQTDYPTKPYSPNNQITLITTTTARSEHKSIEEDIGERKSIGEPNPRTFRLPEERRRRVWHLLGDSDEENERTVREVQAAADKKGRAPPKNWITTQQSSMTSGAHGSLKHKETNQGKKHSSEV